MPNIRFRCPTCGDVIDVPDTKAGRQHMCANCMAMLTVPLATPAASPAAAPPPVPPPAPKPPPPVQRQVIPPPPVNPPPPAAYQPPPQPTPQAQPPAVPPMPMPAIAHGHKYCSACGSALHLQAVICPHCGVPQAAAASPSGLSQQQLSEAHSQKMSAGLLAILLAGFGIHKFVMGYNGPGVTYLLVLIFTCGIGSAVVMVWISIVEGVIYLSKTDEDYHRIYIAGRKAWF